MKHVYRVFLVICLAILTTSCANPLNQATSNRYSATCAEAERNGQLEVAEQACYRALVNVEWGNLGQEQKSQRLYNLARIKRQLSKFSEAEDLLKQSLAIEEKLTPPSDIRIGRRLVELSVNCAAQNKWDEGVKNLDQVLPIAQQFSGQERTFLSLVLTEYGKALRENNKINLAEGYEAASASLK